MDLDDEVLYMNEEIEETNWAGFLREFSNRNQGRATRLGVFEASNGVANDYWIHDGVPVVALDAYTKNGKTKVDLFFHNYTHSIDDAAKLVHIEDDGKDNGLDILDAGGNTTVLRFENWQVGSED